MEILVKHAVRTQSVLENVSQKLESKRVMDAKVILEDYFQITSNVIFHLESGDLSKNTKYSLYRSHLRHISDSVARKKAAISTAGHKISTIIRIMPENLMDISIMRFQVAAIKKLQQVQLQLTELKLVCFYPDDSFRSKRFPDHITSILSSSYDRDPYPRIEEISRLQQTSGLSEKQISMWFTNRRCRSKRQKMAQREKSVDDDAQSDTNTHSPPDSPKEALYPRPNSITLSSDDGFFAESRRQAKLEFYQTMVCNNTRRNWDDFAELFVNEIY